MIDRELMNHIVAGRDLSPERMHAAMRAIMTGQATEAQIGGFLVAMRMKGETVPEIAAATAVMRELATDVPVDANLAEQLVDTCGTGGDAAGLFNVSTAAAFAVAAAGGHVAKHGNRSVSGKSGSADLLDVAGIAIDTTPEQVAECIRRLGVGFMFAPAHHGAMKYAIGPRRELGIRTIFNIIGPLTNPAGAANQVMGVFNGHLCEPLAEVLSKLGSRHVMVVHGEDGLDELSINAPTRVAELRDGRIESYKLAPEDVGLERGSLDALRVESAAESFAIVRDVLAGKPGIAADMVAFNAGAALYVAGHAPDLRAGVTRASEVLASGAAGERMAALAELTQQMTGRSGVVAP
ncbi:anthranilate phosphoribosyltransferase [Salinisphaera orenii MK-B5]|uniref:Anthranilate phosphoribosyltransferase n=1 Tax=Salinisphaera orenii MK-B5 TaxID=856730 RepID=A0A423PLQ4_9GAMM|nr:anthranilate phosphoribosyltransferase [Salinisphaera orenii]ROO26441.1 anthranilate phosphoribosyltransferase [Salinisphaera orenii MK-B5]